MINDYISKDSDGKFILDYLCETRCNNSKSNETDYTNYYYKIHEFASTEYERVKNDPKLGVRYSQFLNYVESRKHIWLD